MRRRTRSGKLSVRIESSSCSAARIREALEREQEEGQIPGEVTEMSFATKSVTFTTAIAVAVLFGVSRLV